MNDQIPRNPHPVKPPADLPPPRKESLQDEVKRLKSEVERLGAFRTHTIIPNEILIAENARLKAEVERLHKYVETMERESMSDEYDINHQTRIINGLLTDKERLQAEVERLRKAGDNMADYIMVVPGTPMAHVYLIDWNAAKEGKPSA